MTMPTMTRRKASVRPLDCQVRDRIRDYDFGQTPTELVNLLPRIEYAPATPHMPAEGTKPTLPAAAELSAESLGRELEAICEVLRRAGGASPKASSIVDELRERCVRYRDRVVGIRDFFAAPERAGLDPADSAAVIKAAEKEEERLGKIGDAGLSQALEAGLTNERSILSLYVLYVQSGLDGKEDGIAGNMPKIYHMNIDVVTSEAASERGELTLMDLVGADFPETGGMLPVFETPVLPNGKAAEVTALPFDERYLFQQMATHLVLGGELETKAQCRFYADLAWPRMLAVLANISTRDVGSKPEKVAEIVTDLRETYMSNEESFKALFPVGNAPIGRLKSRWDKDHVAIYPSFVMMAMALRNECRSDRSITLTLISPIDNALDKDLYHGLLAIHLRDCRRILNELGLPMLVEVHNERGDAILSVLNTSRSAWSGGPYSLELLQGTQMLNIILAHWLIQKKGSPNTRRTAKAIGRDINLLLRERASEVLPNAPFLEGWCEWERSDCVRETVKDAEGNEVLDAEGNPTYTGHWQFIFYVHVKYRESTESFVINLVN